MIQSIPALDFSFDFHLFMPSLAATDHKQALRFIAAATSNKIGMGERILFDRMVDKEKKEPAAMGQGIAIMPIQMSGLKESFNVFVRFKKPVGMNAPDNMGVDLFCLLLTPEREGSSYLKNFARLSRFLKDDNAAKKLRGAEDEKSLKHILSNAPSKKLAA